MKKILSAILLSATVLASVAVFTACGSQSASNTLPSATNLGGSQTVAEVTDSLKDAGLSNADLFQEWALDFAETAGNPAGILDAWSLPDDLSYDLAKGMDGWEKQHDYSDMDCQMTAFLLLDGILQSESVEKDYTGTYLMFDLDAIDNVSRYEVLKARRELFTTVFGDKPVPDGTSPKDVFANVWKTYGIQVNNDKVSLLSVIIYDPDFKTAFVGHTGVLIDRGDDLLFVEKIAFEQPYQATQVNNLDELLTVLGKRPEYFGETGQPGPSIFINGDYRGELKADSSLDSNAA
jgi:hypothetical protein